MSWIAAGWEPVITSDGSPSLRFLAHEQKELMHHSGGAFSESFYIYGRTLPLISDKVEEPVIMSLGLGLGYNELLVANYFSKRNQKFKMISYEKDNFLKESLLRALDLLPNRNSPEIQVTYEKVFSFFSSSALDALKGAYIEQRWDIQGELHFNSHFESRAHVVFWDAFSRKTSPELWDEPFLIGLFQKLADEEICVVSTYACNGPIKRALKANQFVIEETSGFQTKRQSVLAQRTKGSGFDLSSVSHTR
jgi:tRNA U34 5-methylaminomethyl-2-thiouridine-forming methyltransferase MnmC